MLAELERTAAAAGIARLVLNTGPEQPEAIALYEECGYVPVPGSGTTPRPDAVFLGKQFGGATLSGNGNGPPRRVEDGPCRWFGRVGLSRG